MAGGGVGVNSCSEGFSDGRKTERWRICSHLAPNRLRATRVLPAASAAWDICCYFFFFYIVQAKKKFKKSLPGTLPLDLVKRPKISAVRRLKTGITFVCLQLICPPT